MKIKMGVTGALMISLIASMVPTSASALSCLRPDLLRTLEEAKASPKTYHILVGRFVSDAPKFNPGGSISPKDQFKPKPPVITQSLFKGISLATSRQQDQVLTRFAVDIETSCVGPWCSSPPQSDQGLIAFVEARSGQSPILRISPCPSQTFRADAEQVRKVRQCLTKDCPPEKPNGAFTR